MVGGYANPKPYLECRGALVSRYIVGITRVTVCFMRLAGLLARSS